MAKLIDLTGKQFGRWTVIGQAGRMSYNHEVAWRCQCTCGVYRTIASSELRFGKSHGCARCGQIYRRRREKDEQDRG